MKKIQIFIIVCFIFQYVSSQTRNGFDINNSSIPVEEIKSGGPPKDGIPAIDNPRFLKDSERASLKIIIRCFNLHSSQFLCLNLQADNLIYLLGRQFVPG